MQDDRDRRRRGALEEVADGVDRGAERAGRAVDRGLEDAVVVRLFVRDHPVVAHPVLVDALVVARAIPVGLVVTGVEVEVRVAARRAALAHARHRAQKPDARLEAEVLRRQRADRAHVLRHERVVPVELAARRDEDLVQVAALAHVEDVVLRDLVHEADAARAHHAALAVVDDGGSELDALGLVDGLVPHPLLRLVVVEPVVLQLALAGLVADGAVDRVVQERGAPARRGARGARCGCRRSGSPSRRPRRCSRRAAAWASGQACTRPWRRRARGCRGAEAASRAWAGSRRGTCGSWPAR